MKSSMASGRVQVHMLSIRDRDSYYIESRIRCHLAINKYSNPLVWHLQTRNGVTGCVSTVQDVTIELSHACVCISCISEKGKGRGFADLTDD